MENMELKQRIVNLSKINDTLTNALANQQDEPTDNRGKKLTLNISGQDNEESSSTSKRATDNAEIRRLNKIVEEKDAQIRNLTKIGNELRKKLE